MDSFSGAFCAVVDVAKVEGARLTGVDDACGGVVDFNFFTKENEEGVFYGKSQERRTSFNG